jgi:CheY-like chemotaxis protein
MSTGANADAAPEAIPAAGAAESTAPLAGTRPRVLCVDDEPQVLKMLARTLGRQFEVVTQDDPLAALELARDGRFSVVISDMLMPRMSGTTFLERVKHLAPDTTRLALTGCLESQLPPDVAFGIVTKPFRVPLLQETVSAAAQCHALRVSARGANERAGGVPVHASAIAVSSALGATGSVQASESGLRLRGQAAGRASSIPAQRSAARSIPAARSQPLSLALLGTVVDLWPRATLLGRAMECDIVVNDTRISARHVRFFSSWRGTTVQDVSGTGSVRLNGERLHGVHFIQPGDTISLGAFDIRVGQAGALTEKS